MSSKATFRALREEVGLSQADFAQLMKVHLNSVKRWESLEFSQEPPADAFAILNEAIAKREFIIDATLNNDALDFDNAKTITLTYFRDQGEFDKFGRDEGNFKLANANTRALARELEIEGYTNIEFCYPQEKENVYQQVKRAN